MHYRKLTKQEVSEYRQKMAFIVSSIHDYSAVVIDIFTKHHDIHIAGYENRSAWKKFFGKRPLTLEEFMNSNKDYQIEVREGLPGFKNGYIGGYYFSTKYEVIPDFTKNEQQFLEAFAKLQRLTTHQLTVINNFIRIMDKFGDEKPRLNEVEEINYLDWIDLRFDEWTTFAAEFPKDAK